MNHDQQLSQIKLYIEKMPSLPTTVTKILEICNDPQTSPADLNRIIGVDPVLMGKVLKLINSAYYGLSQEVTSLARAIIMLGINTVKNLALSTAVLATVGRNSNFQALNMEGFWRHSLCTGVTGRLIARQRKVDSKILEEYFIAGLLHDIGKIPLNNRLAEDYIQAMGESDLKHVALYQSEQGVFGIDHTNVGHMILELWKLDEAVREAVLFHHRPGDYQGKNKDIVYTTACANYFANFFEIGFSGDRYPEALPAEVFKHLGISMDFLEGIEDTVLAEIEKASIFLKLSNTR
ncbi:MAG: HDOD domain-containing protein [Spirochaetales bacterium]|nr:HDOD domain-containing protein [Spirochaetales bacterium]